MFIETITIICVIAASLAFSPLMTQSAINISLKPIRIVIARAQDVLKIAATIKVCLGTMFSTLQKSPLASHIKAIMHLMMRCPVIAIVPVTKGLSDGYVLQYLNRSCYHFPGDI